MCVYVCVCVCWCGLSRFKATRTTKMKILQRCHCWWLHKCKSLRGKNRQYMLSTADKFILVLVTKHVQQRRCTIWLLENMEVVVDFYNMPCNWWNWFGSLFWRHLGKIQRLFLISNVSAVNMVGRRGSSPSPNLSATDVKQKETPLTANVATSDTKSRMSPLHSRYPRHWQGTIRHLFSAFFPCPVAVVFRIVNRL